MTRWIDDLPASERAELRDAGRLGGTRFDGPELAKDGVQPVLVSVQETARMMGGIDPDTVYTLCNSGQLPHIRLGRRILVSVDGLKAWVAANDGRDLFAQT